MKANQPSKIFPALLSGVLLLAVTWAFPPGAAAQDHHRMIKSPEVLQSCKVVPDCELRELRGRFDTSFFGLDVVANLDVGKGAFSGSVHFATNVPLEQVNFSGTQVSYNNGNISYQAGIGATSFGSGVYSAVVVAGTNNMVISTTNVNLTIQGLSTLSFTALSTPATTVGIR
jgi:hypothetical protein